MHAGPSDSPYPTFAGVEPFDAVRTPEAERAHRKRMCALGYRIFGSMRWGQLGDGHISARDPILTDHFWLLDWGTPFREATVDQLVLVGPDGRVMDADGNATGAINTAGFNIHAPLLAARPDVVSAAHTHTGFGTPWAANVEPFRALSQESCAFVFDQALFDDEHGSLTVGGSVEEAVGWFVMSERVAEVHVNAPNGRAISDEAAAIAAETLAPSPTGWRLFQWLRRDLVPDPSVVD